MGVQFHSAGEVDDHFLKFAVIVSRHRGQWLLVKHKERATFEVPGGHREPGEDIDQTARRELWEETGAGAYSLRPICPYSVTGSAGETFGMLYFAEVETLSPIPAGSEIESVHLFDTLPDNLTYPHIQPALTRHVEALLAAP